MKGHHIDIVENIAKGIHKTIKNPRYLELGIWKAGCFNRVAPYFAESVAIDIKLTAKDYINVKCEYYCVMTDEYFKNIHDGKQFNMIFIDANHNLEFVKKDFINSYSATTDNGIIILHDTYPSNVEEFKGCKDAYKLPDYIKENKNLQGELVTLPFFYGITIFRKCKKQLLWI